MGQHFQLKGWIINIFLKLNVSLERIREFLLKDEIKQQSDDIIEHKDIKGIAVKVQDSDFGWDPDSDEAILKK